MDAREMTASFERGREPHFYDLEGGFHSNEPLTEAECIGIVVLPREARAFEIPAQGATNSTHFVGDNGFAVSRSSENNGAFVLAARHGFRGGPNEFGIVDGLGAM